MSSAIRRVRSVQRGATFLILMLLVAASLALMGGLLTDTSQANLRLTAQHARQSTLREAAFAGVRWAALVAEDEDAARGVGPAQEPAAQPADAPGQGSAPSGVLQLAYAEVAVESRRVERDGAPALVVKAVATHGADRLELEATLRPGPAGYAIDGFALR